MRNFTQSLLSAAACLTLSAGAWAADVATVEWGNYFDGTTTAGDMSIGVALSGSDVIWQNVLGSTTGAADLFYGADKIFQGAESTAANNGNLAVTKTDAVGKALWTVYSNSGDFANQGGVATVADGTVYFYGKVRHSDGMFDKEICIVDAAGNKTEVGGTVTERYYRLILGKADKDGKVQWIKLFDVENGKAPAGTKDFTADAVTAGGVAADAEGNVYISGAFAMPLTFGETTLTPKSAAAWDGKTQGVNDLFIAKFDAEGNYVASLTAESSPQKGNAVQSVTVSGGKLYFVGTATSAEGEAKATLGGKEFTASENASPFVGCASTADLSVEWLTSATGVKQEGQKSFACQGLAVSESCGNVWVTGALKGTLNVTGTQVSIASTQVSMNEGLIIRLNAANGEVLAGAVSRTAYNVSALASYVSAFQNPARPDKVYVYGYMMNAKEGAFIHTYNAENLQADTNATISLIKDGGVPTAYGFAYDSEASAAYFTVRGNKAFTAPSNSSIVFGSVDGVPSTWAILAAKVALPEGEFSGVEAIAAEEVQDVSVVAVTGGITISASADAAITVYDIAGRSVVTVSVAAGAVETIALPAGIYVAGGVKVAVL